MTDVPTTEARLRDAVERMRERARQAPTEDAIADDTPQASSPAADHAADTGPASAPTPAPRHWSEAGERDEDASPTRAALSLETGDLRARGTACARLRRLLSDARWHEVGELVAAGGLRFGARLLELRRGLDGAPPIDIDAERRPRAGRFVWFYRLAPLGARLPPPGRFA